MAETGTSKKRKDFHPIQKLSRRLFAIEDPKRSVTREGWHRLGANIAIFILVPLMVGLVMFMAMLSLVHTYMEDQVTAQVEILQALASRRLTVWVEEMERVASYFNDGRIAEEKMGNATERLLAKSSQTGCGVLRLDGSAVCGRPLQISEYPSVRNAFRGRGGVRYRRDEGLAFTAPIYNGDNIKYVLYEFLDPDTLFEGFGEGCFQGQSSLMLADSTQQLLVPIYGDEVLETDPVFQQPEVQAAIEDISRELALGSTATVYLEIDGEEQFLFVTDMKQTNFYLMGVVPHDVVAGHLSILSGGVLAVFSLLLLLLLVGTLRVVNYDARARESDALREAKRQVEQAYQSRGRFLASMSHELRTPINTIMGFNEMILRETREADTRERALDMRSASQILLGLINDVLDFSKIESRMLTIIPATYSLPVLLRDLELLSENRARSKSLDFRMVVRPDLPVGLYGDENRIRQVMTNLLTNAIKYTREGSVTMEVSGTRLGGDQISICFRVTDTGIGIREEDIPKIFVPYARVDEERNRNVEGSGLGFSIITNLLRLMGSELKLESVYGKGSSFWFELRQTIKNDKPIGDLKKWLSEQAKDFQYRAALYAPMARVLVVDDNSMNRNIFKGLLKRTAIQIDAVASGEKCLEQVQKQKYDAIFMDHLMPGMDGVETLHRLKELPCNLCLEAPVVALTANAFDGAEAQYKAMGFDAFLSKPIAPDKLEDLLKEILPPERLETLPEEELEPAPAPAAAQPCGEMPKIEGVSWDYAALRIPDKALLMTAMKEYYRSICGAGAELEAMAEALDDPEQLSNYRTRVHSIKSTSAMVGILTVSELARILEDAARNGQRERIRAMDPVLRELLETMKERLRPFVGEDGEKQQLTDLGQLISLLRELRPTLEEMDITGSDAVMEKICAFACPSDIQPAVDGLADEVRALEFDEAAEDAAALLERLEQMVRKDA